LSSLSTIEEAVMAAEHAARAALLDAGGAFAVGSKIPSPPPEFLAASLYQSAQEAGLTAEDMW
jgi:hypothetical protein